jgi:hypothetical protein
MGKITEEHRKEFFGKLFGYTVVFILLFSGICHLSFWAVEKGMSLEGWYNPFRNFVASGFLLMFGGIAGCVPLIKNAPKKLTLVCVVIEFLVVIYFIIAIKMFNPA